MCRLLKSSAEGSMLSSVFCKAVFLGMIMVKEPVTTVKHIQICTTNPQNLPDGVERFGAVQLADFSDGTQDAECFGNPLAREAADYFKFNLGRPHYAFGHVVVKRDTSVLEEQQDQRLVVLQPERQVGRIVLLGRVFPA
jgi:hypothetical protein